VSTIPPLFAGLLDDAAVFPPGSAVVDDAVAWHRSHRAAWYAELVGPLLVPVDALEAVGRALKPGEQLEVGLIGAGAGSVEVPAGVVVRHVEIAVAKRGEDPVPGLLALLPLARERPVYAEIPLTSGLFRALDLAAEARRDGAAVAVKFRTGGLAAELFPRPAELAAVICGCRERELPFKLTAGLHHAVRHTDPSTGFTHHGFLNVLAAVLAADRDAGRAHVTGVLGAGDPVPLVEAVRGRLAGPRPLWTGFGTCDIQQPMADLRLLGLLPAAPPAAATGSPPAAATGSPPVPVEGPATGSPPAPVQGPAGERGGRPAGEL
jgi:hypothetical protein